MDTNHHYFYFKMTNFANKSPVELGILKTRLQTRKQSHGSAVDIISEGQRLFQSSELRLRPHLLMGYQLGHLKSSGFLGSYTD